MVEMAMPVMTGPATGNQTGGSCDFRCSLSVNVMDRMGAEGAVKAEALNLATADRELNQVDPIGFYKLFVREATYRDKGTGEIVTSKTLVSNDWNGESIAVWTDAGEHGTGSKEEYRQILSRANSLAATDGAATMFWLSPGMSRRNDGLPEHRGYLWKKENDTEVTAYSYQFTGSADSLTHMLSSLSEEASFFDSYSLFWQNENHDVSHGKIFSAYESSLSFTEQKSASEYLDRFRQETGLPDSILEERVSLAKENYQQKLTEAYLGDIETAVKSVVSGFLSLAETVSETPEPAFKVDFSSHYIPGFITESVPLLAAYQAEEDRKKKRMEILPEVSTQNFDDIVEKSEKTDEKQETLEEELKKDISEDIPEEPLIAVLILQQIMSATSEESQTAIPNIEFIGHIVTDGVDDDTPIQTETAVEVFAEKTEAITPLNLSLIGLTESVPDEFAVTPVKVNADLTKTAVPDITIQDPSDDLSPVNSGGEYASYAAREKTEVKIDTKLIAVLILRDIGFVGLKSENSEEDQIAEPNEKLLLDLKAEIITPVIHSLIGLLEFSPGGQPALITDKIDVAKIENQSDEVQIKAIINNPDDLLEDLILISVLQQFFTTEYREFVILEEQPDITEEQKTTLNELKNTTFVNNKPENDLEVISLMVPVMIAIFTKITDKTADVESIGQMPNENSLEPLLLNGNFTEISEIQEDSRFHENHLLIHSLIGHLETSQVTPGMVNRAVAEISDSPAELKILKQDNTEETEQIAVPADVLPITISLIGLIVQISDTHREEMSENRKEKYSDQSEKLIENFILIQVFKKLYYLDQEYVFSIEEQKMILYSLTDKIISNYVIASPEGVAIPLDYRCLRMGLSRLSRIPPNGSDFVVNTPRNDNSVSADLRSYIISEVINIYRSGIKVDEKEILEIAQFIELLLCKPEELDPVKSEDLILIHDMLPAGLKPVFLMFFPELITTEMNQIQVFSKLPKIQRLRILKLAMILIILKKKINDEIIIDFYKNLLILNMSGRGQKLKKTNKLPLYGLIYLYNFTSCIGYESVTE